MSIIRHSPARATVRFSVPQMRWRMFFIGWRRDLASNGGFPLPTYDRWGIGDLVPNRTATPEAAAGFVTIRDAIGDLPPVSAGCTAGEYHSLPDGPYQEAMRLGAPDELHNHYAARLAPQNVRRIERLAPGDDWRSLPLELLPSGMRRALRKDHTRRYRRMQWIGVARSIISGFGAWGETRTLTWLPIPDFESGASTDFATQALGSGILRERLAESTRSRQAQPAQPQASMQVSYGC